MAAWGNAARKHALRKLSQAQRHRIDAELDPAEGRQANPSAASFPPERERPPWECRAAGRRNVGERGTG